MNIPDAIAELGLMLQQPGLALNENGSCSLRIDGRLNLEIQTLPDTQTLHLASVVSVVELLDEPQLALLLRANLMPSMTGGAHFSASPEAELLLEQRIDMQDLDLATFSGQVEAFVNYVEGWEDALAGGELPAF